VCSNSPGLFVTFLSTFWGKYVLIGQYIAILNVQPVTSVRWYSDTVVKHMSMAFRNGWYGSPVLEAQAIFSKVGHT
jgi:hypothetical protein